MLKLLLSHWKAHRKKPSLLPEDGDVRFEDPSTINPLFEDSDSSISSTKATAELNSATQSQTVSKTELSPEEEENNVSVVNELIDVSIPSNLNNAINSKLNASHENLNFDKSNSLQNFETDIVPESQSLDVLPPKSDAFIDSENNLKPSTSESNSPSEVIATILNKDEAKATEAKSEKEMRIYNPPSTSAISKDKNPVNINSNETESSQDLKTKLKETSKTNDQNFNQEKLSKIETKGIKGENSSINANPNDLLAKNNPTSSPLKNPKKSSSVFHETKPNEGNESNYEEKPTKLRARAIDELIKKFQGQSPESKKRSNELAKPKKENVLKSNEPVTKSNPLPNKSELEKESLSNIFKFPPPPPLEALQNESSLHGQILKGTKQKIFSSASSKTKDTSEVLEASKTRSDSSLERTLAESSNKLKKNAEKTEKMSQKEIINKIETSSVAETHVEKSNNRHTPSVKDLPEERKTTKQSKLLNDATKSFNNIKEDKVNESVTESSEKNLDKTKLNKKLHTTEDKIAVKKEPSTLNAIPETNSDVLNTSNINSSNKNEPIPANLKKKSSISKAVSKQVSPKENENVKSHSEDSGITRGDQISSETTQDAPVKTPSEDATAVSSSSKRTRKEKKVKGINKKICKNCKRIHDDGAIFRRSQYDDYYDGLTGARHVNRNKHSDSWTSDLSWEEKELLRRLRSKRSTVRSNTPSTKSRHSRHRFIDENHFRRPHKFRRSASDESTFHGSSICSCDECWALYLKDYAHGRTSLRGMPPIQEMCTCGTSRNNFLGRRVQFRSDIIHEASPSERTTRTTTPAPNTEGKQEDVADDASSQQSSKTKEGSVHKDPDGTKEKTQKTLEEAYRFMTPWELEEWDLFMRKELLKKRRRRARCMGIMALAMVVFVGLVVTILMVYLRRKVI